MKPLLQCLLITFAALTILLPHNLNAAAGSEKKAEEGRRKKGEGAKRMGSQHDIDSFINYINGRIRSYQTRHGLPELGGENLRAARKQAFKDWAYEHHEDLPHLKLSPDQEGLRFLDIKNTEFPSNLGVVDMDWLATMGNLGARGGLGEIAYWVGKESWLLGRQATLKKEYWGDRSTTLNTYPDTNWRAVTVSDRLLSGQVSVEELFKPQQRVSPAVQQMRDKLQKHFTTWGNFSWWGSGQDRFRSDNTWSPPQETRTFIPNPARSDGPRSLIPAIRNMFNASPVGGVALQGAGSVLEGFGEIKGFRLDPRGGELILLGETETATGLRGLSLSDMVTVFLAVYASAGPTLTIDPDPQDPEGPRMWVISDPSTKDTFVHWVLYQCDRIMKSYGLAKDNLSGQPIESGVAGYSGVMDAIFLGSEGARQSVWERFWIVPAFSRWYAPRRMATELLEFPLEVRTKKCVFRAGKMVDDEGAPSSPGALAFRRWFTANYDAIGQETLLLPPVEFGFDSPIDVFAALRRIAAITAIAERLRDQGAPMPAWMIDYPVPRVTVDPTTPSISTRRDTRWGNTLIQTRLFGGVELVFNSAPKTTFETQDSITRLPESAREAALGRFEEAQDFEKALSTLGLGAGLAVSPVAGSATVNKLARLPGDAASMLGACQLEEIDLELPVGPQRSLRLTRRFNSTFRTEGPWGTAWSLDLPRLQTNWVQASRSARSRTLQQVYELYRPLASGPIRFVQIGPIPGRQTSGYIPELAPNILGLVRARTTKGAAEVHRVLFKDGGSWDFDATGRLAGSTHNDVTIDYAYDRNGRVARITGTIPGQPESAIGLVYDPNGRIKAAIGRSGAAENSAEYVYSPGGQLTEVRTKGGVTRYGYHQGKVAEVGYEPFPNGEVHSTLFEYDSQGRVTSQKQSDGTTLRLQVDSSNEGPTMSVWDENLESPFATVSYDADLQPSVVRFRDGSEIRHRGSSQGRPIIALLGAGGQPLDIPGLTTQE